MTNNFFEPQSPTPVELEVRSPLPYRLPIWRLLIPLLVQTGIILAIPARSAYTYVTGETVVLQTIPVDPYDPLRGYSQTLDYDISQLRTLQKLPGWQEVVTPKSISSDYLQPGTELYVTLSPPKNSSTQPPQAWQPVKVSRSRPTSLAADQIAIKGKSTGFSIKYGLETYYFPESRQQEINRDIRQAQTGRQQRLVVEAKVDNQGNAVPVSFWVSDREYRF
ncbi:GDYXXLXY domain-containing protein [Aliterella atlantica]|uniref:Membrane-anchored protein n=1 Tax=Aliterella atlantica CENA595 TaxID=1618023 RepID=A0A0D8ZSC8_9CYAN|nr:GDYXXLXY domain-containing protein [Aliterella atlantica]KJH71409.1 membrane-anchored protein [Aliterella atlantica CENA595]